MFSNTMKGVITVDKKFQIRLSATEDVKEFVRAARKCEFDIDLTYQRAVVDAKSILGVFALGLERPLVVNCHGTNQEFEESISKFTM